MPEIVEVTRNGFTLPPCHDEWDTARNLLLMRTPPRMSKKDRYRTVYRTLLDLLYHQGWHANQRWCRKAMLLLGYNYYKSADILDGWGNTAAHAPLMMAATSYMGEDCGLADYHADVMYQLRACYWAVVVSQAVDHGSSIARVEDVLDWHVRASNENIADMRNEDALKQFKRLAARGLSAGQYSIAVKDLVAVLLLIHAAAAVDRGATISNPNVLFRLEEWVQ